LTALAHPQSCHHQGEVRTPAAGASSTCSRSGFTNLLSSSINHSDKDHEPQSHLRLSKFQRRDQTVRIFICCEPCGCTCQIRKFSSFCVREEQDILLFAEIFKPESDLFLGTGWNWQVSGIHLSAFLCAINKPHATHPRMPPVLLQVLFRMGQQVPFCD